LSNQRRHILFIIPDLAGGTGTFCKSLARGLRSDWGNEFIVSLLTFRPPSSDPADAALFDQTFALGTEVHNNWRRGIDLLSATMRLGQTVSRIQPDLIFCIGTFSNVVASLSISRIPIVMSDHLNMTLRLRASRWGFATKWFMRRTYPGNLMIAASKEMIDDLRENFGVRRATVIPNSIDASIIRRRAEESGAAPPAKDFFIWIGRLTKQKDIPTLLRAFAIARKNGLKEQLLLAGDGEDRAALETLSRDLGLSGSAHFLGHCANPYPLIKQARGLVLSSIWEGFAYSPIEAMALGTPVISTACPSGPVEILGGGEFGLLVPPADPSALAAAMQKLSTDDTLHDILSKKSLERADQLSVTNMARAYRDAFHAEIDPPH
jgi:glycosyltransferase involved in cell wall biosynthesis